LPFLVEAFRAAGIVGALSFPDAAVLPVGAHSGGNCLRRCPLVARKVTAVPALRVTSM
jgi:hypothetical protein